MKALQTAVALTGLLAIVLGTVGIANALNSKVSIAAAPKGFNHFLVYLAEPTLAPGEESTFTDPTHLDFFQHTVMGRTSAQVAEQEQLAKQYFADRFGLEFGAGSSGFTFSAFVLNPHVNYRAYIASGMTVPNTGWKVRDGGFQVVLTEDTTLHGTYGDRLASWLPRAPPWSSATTTSM